MKAAEITDKLIDGLKTGRFRHARVNFANGDMVGHTGALSPTVLAVEAVDLQIGRIVPVIRALGGALIVTADHGNADEMFEWDKKTKSFQRDPQGRPRPKTSHTLNPVPCYIDAQGSGLTLASIEKPGIANVSATTLHLLGFAPPADFLPSLLA